jgi:hypothetical protein
MSPKRFLLFPLIDEFQGLSSGGGKSKTARGEQEGHEALRHELNGEDSAGDVTETEGGKVNETKKSHCASGVHSLMVHWSRACSVS